VALACCAIGLFAAPENLLGMRQRPAYSEGMKVGFTCVAARAIGSPVAAA